MIDHYKTKGYVDLISLPREFLLFKFSCKEDMEKVLELGPWFLGRKGLVIKKCRRYLDIKNKISTFFFLGLD